MNYKDKVKFTQDECFTSEQKINKTNKTREECLKKILQVVFNRQKQ